ncbi:MAG: hypothetical protein ACLFUS_00715 [Candidatus Sumerlaeia bacterium]
MIQFEEKSYYQPLDIIKIQSDAEKLRLYDGMGRLYAEGTAENFSARVSGAVGYHVAVALDSEGQEVERRPFRVDCETEIDDEGGVFKRMLYMLEGTFERMYAQKKNRFLDGERVYHMHIITSRDTIHAIKGAKYFIDHVRDVIDLFAEHQCDNGMIWDFGTTLDNPEALYHFEWRWGKQFSKRVGHDQIFARQPCMNDVEHMFIGGIHLIWKATGDDPWMASKLDAGLKAMEYARRSPYTWSEKFQLIKRPYCLDLWDFQSDYDAALVGGDEMDAIPGVTKYGVFHGDNTGMADSCRKLAEMLEYVGRNDDAKRARDFSEHLLERLEEVAWNGEFYTHHVSEEPEFKRDFGVDESTQVSLSNAYAVNRGIGHDKVKAIIETYKRIRREMPESSPAEWFQMYPPFPKGWHIPEWIYTNGAVTILVAGELAHGCFEHGYEDYGADIMKRTVELFTEYGNTFIGGLWGKRPEEPERSFETVDISAVCNAGLTCEEGQAHPGWGDHPGNDMRELPTGSQLFEGIPFDVIQAEENEGRSCLRLARNKKGWAEKAEIPLGCEARTLYFLHACSGSGQVVGELSLLYEDGTRHDQYIMRNEHVMTFWNPSESPKKNARKIPDMVLAWTGANEDIGRVGLSAWGLKNPHPGKIIARVELRAPHSAASWFVVGMTTSDTDPWFEPGPFGGGAPPNWSAGALMYALMDGMVGANDEATNLQSLRFTPRWVSAGVDKVTACARLYEAGGYVRYTYQRDGKILRFDLAASAEERIFEILMPHGEEPQKLSVNGRAHGFVVKQIEDSCYVVFEQNGLEAMTLEIQIAEKQG